MDQVALRDYQIADLSFLIANRRAALLHDPGVGKTPPVCVYMWYLWNNLGEKSMWVMPKQLFHKNKRELVRFSHFTEDEVVILDGPKWRDQLNNPNAKVFILGATRHRLSWQEVISTQPAISTLLADEPHMYWSTHGSKATMAMYATLDKIRGFVPMTGTVVKGRLDSAYPLIHGIEPRYYASFEVFMAHHAQKDIYGKITWQNTARLGQIFGTHAIRRSFESVYGPESKVILSEFCDMKPLQREAYEEFEQKAILELDDYMLTGKTGGVHTIRCRQIMAHPELWGIAEGEKTGKDELLDVHLAHHAATGQPLVIFGAFKAEQARILKVVQSHGMVAGLMNGDTPTKQRDELDVGFINGTIQVLVGSPQVATVGYNWQHCDHTIFSSLDYGDDTFYQAYRRFIRGIRSTPLRITLLQYNKSIDQRIMNIVRKKSALANSVDGTREIYTF